MQDHRQTKQQNFILSCLKQNSDKHLTILQIKNLLYKNNISVGTATLYRHLNKLSQLNMVRKFKLDGQSSACYQYIENYNVCYEHFHLICSKCSKTIHFQNKSLIELFQKINKNNSFKIDFPKTIFYGTCCNCLTQK